MKNSILDFLKGICIGIANIIPGFSGGTMAVILNIYERFINGISNLFSHPLKTLKDIWAILLGIAVGVVISISAITKLLSLFPIPTVLFFVGLIIGSIPNLSFEYRHHGGIKIVDLIPFIVSFAIIIILPLINSTPSIVSDVDFLIILIMFLMGIICSAAMIIPGVSGSLVLMAFGYYLFILEELGFLLDHFIAFDLSNISNSIIIIASFGIGAIIGLVFVSKLLSMLFKKYPRIIYATILGLLIASPFAIIYSVIGEYNSQIIDASPISYIVGVIMLALGALVAFLPNKISNKK